MHPGPGSHVLAPPKGPELPASSPRFTPGSTVPVVSLNTSGCLPSASPIPIFSDHFPEVGQWCQGSRGLSLSIPGPSSEDPWVSWPSQRRLCPPAPSAGGQEQVCPVPEQRLASCPQETLPPPPQAASPGSTSDALWHSVRQLAVKTFNRFIPERSGGGG